MRQISGSVVSAFMRPALRRSYYYVLDLIDRVNGRLVPPRSMRFVGGGDFFEEIGEEFKGYFINLAGLRPNERVLDVGCGIGRMAIPLTGYLSDQGEYWGFDTVKSRLDWCEKEITSRFGNFRFQHFDINNKNYNPMGKMLARDFKFPFKDGHFDLVFLSSVFTHMLPLDLENYLSEISRVLGQGGRCLTTFFLLNAESRNLILDGRSTLSFQHGVEGCLTVDRDNPEAAIAYEEELVLRLLDKYGLGLSRPIRYGSWCGRKVSPGYQDILVATKSR